MDILLKQYKEEIVPELMKRFKYKSIMQVPKLDKVVVNIGLGDLKENPKALDRAIEDLTQITGQKPVTTYAKKSIANFKIRQGIELRM